MRIDKIKTIFKVLLGLLSGYIEEGINEVLRDKVI